MTRIFAITFIFLFLSSCKTSQNTAADIIETYDFSIAFGSCNKTDKVNLLWDDVLATHPDLWIWGGDNIYGDTDNMVKMDSMYQAQNEIVGYKELKKSTPIIGTWDDHDYGLNDGGFEFKAKKESQQVFLDFMDVSKDSPRRKREGVFVSHQYDLPRGSIKVIVLDTRYFRTALTPDTETKKRNNPNVYGQGTILGEAQWAWLTTELQNSNADFNLIVSSIQVLSNDHGFECWGNFPHEVDKLKASIVDSGAKGVVVLSGDRHISEFSREKIDGLSYPLVDFTSSGLTHAYSKFDGEPNPYRVGEVVATESFGTLDFDFEKKTINFKMLGNKGKVLGILKQEY